MIIVLPWIWSAYLLAAYNASRRLSASSADNGAEPPVCFSLKSTCLLSGNRNTEHGTTSRRVAFATFLLLMELKAPLADAVMESKQDVFKVGEALGVDASKKRLVQAQASLTYLLDNYEEISKGGGDNVRRYLGTVGTSSGMYGISKVLKELQDEASDMVSYTDTMLEFQYSLQAADTALYSANFVEFSAATTKPEKFFEDALSESRKMQSYLREMSRELDVK